MGGIKPFVTFEAGGKAWQVRLDNNALCLAEQLTNRRFTELGAGIGFSDIRAGLFAGMKKFHPRITQEQVGDLMDEIGFQEAAKIFFEAYDVAHARDEEPEKNA